MIIMQEADASENVYFQEMLVGFSTRYSGHLN